MKKITLGIILALHCTAHAHAHAASINSITHQATPSGQYEVVFKNAGIMPKTFTTNNPDTVVLDFADTKSNLTQREINIATNGVYGINVVEGAGRTRAVVNLASPIRYKIESRGSDIVLVIDSVRGKLSTSAQASVVTSNTGGLFNNLAVSTPQQNVGHSTTNAPELVVAVNNPQNAIAQPRPTAPLPSLDLAFNQRGSGKGILSFVLPTSVHNVNVRQDGNKIIALLDGYYASASEQKRMEVGSYDTPVDIIDIFRKARGSEIVLNIKRDTAFEYASYQNDDVYTIEVKPAPVDTNLQQQIDELQGFSPTKRYRGAPLSLNFQDIEVRAVLQIIAEFTNNNIVVSDAVTGNITLRLDSVPWDQALDIILKTKGLGMRENGSVIYIAPATELDQRELDALKVIQERDQLVPATTELIQIKYASAADLANILERSRETSGSDRSSYSQDSILSSKGTVSVDLRTNMLLVSDIPSKLQAVRDLVAKLDEPVRQVLIDARLVLTNDSFSRNLGAKLGLSFFNTGSKALISGSGTVDAANELNRSLVNQLGSNSDQPLAVPDIGSRLGVNMPGAASGTGYGLAILGADYLVDLELSALQTEGKAEILSSPRIVTQDGKKARIASGQEIPYKTTSAQGTKTEFKKAELSLDVTPRIAPDNRVDMILDIKKDEPNYSRQTPDGVPIDTNQLETNVLVDNGETIVLGGIYEQRQSLGNSKVPLLGDLPVIGNAFKTTTKNFDKSELLIFVTPRIIDNRLSDYDKFSNLRN